ATDLLLDRERALEVAGSRVQVPHVRRHAPQVVELGSDRRMVRTEQGDGRLDIFLEQRAGLGEMPLSAQGTRELGLVPERQWVVGAECGEKILLGGRERLARSIVLALREQRLRTMRPQLGAQSRIVAGARHGGLREIGDDERALGPLLIDPQTLYQLDQ